MARQKSFWDRTFGKKFGLYDVILLLILISYPVYVYYSNTTDFILINAGIDAIVKDIGGYAWGGVFVAYFIGFIIRRAKK